jgi:hypothetical protein
MAATQRTTGSTRFRGPTVITLRGAGSLGHDAQTVGAGADVGLAVQIPSGQTANAFQIEKPDGTVIYAIGPNGNPSVGSSQNVSSQIAQVTLTAANIIAMNGAPVSILAAPGAGLAIVVDFITVQTKPTATHFTGGGVVTFQYHGTAVLPHDAADSIAAAVITSGTGTLNQMAPISAGIQPPANTGIDITNATAAFATGTGTAVVTIGYRVVTLS